MRKPSTPPEDTPDAEPEVDQPGLGKLREAVVNQATERLPPGDSLRKDATAGLNGAISSVPYGMAAGLLAGVNPVYGLYACTMGPIVGGILSSTQLAVITTTSVAALGVGEVLLAQPNESRDNMLFVTVILIGAFQLLFGLLRLGRLTRFVSYSVMTGFISGIAVLIVLTQLPTVIGYQPNGGSRIVQTLDLLVNLDQTDPLTLGMAALTLALALTLPRTRLRAFGILVAIAVPSALVALFGLQSVQTVRDIGDIPSGLPIPIFPSFAVITVDVLTGALAVAIITLIQSAGVSQSVPNPDGSRRRMSRDFISQGAANIVSGFFRGLPVGGSLGTTAISVTSGARTRWATIFAGLWMAVIVTLLPGLVSYVAMPTLGMLLIFASLGTIKIADELSIWRTGWPSRLASISTFLATLVLPFQIAVGIGVALSALLYVYSSSFDVSVVELVERPDGRIEERRPSDQLPSRKVTVLDVYGNLFFGGARALERLLPTPQGARNPVVILRLHGRTTFGATLIEVLSNYADQLSAVNGRLYLVGLSQNARNQIVRTGKLHLNGPVWAYLATPILGQSTQRALAHAQAWLVSLDKPRSEGNHPSDGAGREDDQQ